MLKINRYIFFIILVFSFLSEDINEQSDFSFRNISVKDGLAESTVKEIFEDENGFIYIGTENGLDVFNGYEFKNYNMNSFDDLSILGNKVSCIYEDSENKIWVGTELGVSIFDPASRLFSRPIIPEDINDQVLEDPETIVDDANGKV